MWSFYAFALPVTLAMVVVTLHHFASSQVDRVARFTVGYAWFVSLSIVILVPIDVSSTLSGDPQTMASTAKHVSWMWSWAYWSTQFLTWAIIPIHQGYADAGDFTVLARLKTSLRDNLLFYGIMGALGIVGLIGLLAAGKFKWDAIMGFAIAASNAFGLFTGAFLLGFGLVELPRGLWRHADMATRQQWLMHRLGRVATKLDEGHQELSTVIVATDDPSFKPAGGRVGEDDMDYDTDEKSMAVLRRRLRIAVDTYMRLKSEYTAIVWEALELEDTIKNIGLGHAGDWQFISTLRPPRTGRFAHFLDSAEWLWRCALRPLSVQLLAIILAVMSMAIIFAEATIVSNGRPDLSLFSILIRSAKNSGELIIQVLTSVPLVYICVCTYYSVFRLGMFSFYYLVPKNTDPYSLLLNASLCCRFIAPMSYNFLNLIHVGDTTFAKRMGQMDNIPFFGREFNKVVPIAMVIYTVLVAGNVFNRIVDFFGSWRRFRFVDDDNETDGYAAAGRLIIQKERSGLERGQGVGESVISLSRNVGAGGSETGVEDSRKEADDSSQQSSGASSQKAGTPSSGSLLREAIANKYYVQKKEGRGGERDGRTSRFPNTVAEREARRDSWEPPLLPPRPKTAQNLLSSHESGLRMSDDRHLGRGEDGGLGGAGGGPVEGVKDDVSVKISSKWNSVKAEFSSMALKFPKLGLKGSGDVTPGDSFLPTRALFDKVIVVPHSSPPLTGEERQSGTLCSAPGWEDVTTTTASCLA
ncbi:hypothetical protein CBR_g24418 [Chara braunii]|uniref:LMBR1-like membrane protein n=1 Tax=Chara braunii TaxID=69332 RepID=A0A388JMP3_CHABU|nr:hypothetical protein CBR_g24418 [Chara braunii]|eukprot:GBG59074.1 hypothetical protein CBR_g24418 [Chara braunii]